MPMRMVMVMVMVIGVVMATNRSMFSLKQRNTKGPYSSIFKGSNPLSRALKFSMPLSLEATSLVKGMGMGMEMVMVLVIDYLVAFFNFPSVR